MKKIVTMCLALALLVAMGSVSAGSAGDPLVTRSYAEGKYSDSLVAAGVGDSEAALNEVYDSALQALRDHVAGAAGEWGGIHDYGEVRGHVKTVGQEFYRCLRTAAITVEPGGSFTLLRGVMKVNVLSGDVIDVSTGSKVKSGSYVKYNARYFCTEDARAVYTAEIPSAYSADGEFNYTWYVFPESDIYMQFLDIVPGAWYKEFVEFVAERGVVKGMTDGTFDPEVRTSRAHVLTMLMRLTGQEPDTAAGPYWFSDVLRWAEENGVAEPGIDGFGDCSRQEAVEMLYLFTKNVLKLDVSASADLSRFSDAGLITDEYADAMEWAVALGIIEGHSDNTIDPFGGATRAQISKIFTVYLKSEGVDAAIN